MDQSAVLKARNPGLNYQPGRLIIVDTPPPRAPTSPASRSPTRAITRAHVKALNCGPCKTRIAEPAPANGNLLWRGDEAARKVVSANRARLTGPGARRCADAANWSSDPSPISSTAAACVAPGCANTRTSTNVIRSISQDSPRRPDAHAVRPGHAAEGRRRPDGLHFRSANRGRRRFGLIAVINGQLAAILFGALEPTGN